MCNYRGTMRASDLVQHLEDTTICIASCKDIYRPFLTWGPAIIGTPAFDSHPHSSFKVARLLIQYLQQALTQSTPDQTAPCAHRLAGARVVLRGNQARVDLDQVHGDQVARLVDALGDIVTLAQGQAATHGGAGTWGPLGVEGVDVEAEVDGGVVADVSKGHLHDATNAMSVFQLLALVPPACEDQSWEWYGALY